MHVNLYLKSCLDYSPNNIFFYDNKHIGNNHCRKGNASLTTINQNSTYKSINYSTANVVMNGLCIHLQFKNVFVEKYYDKYKCNIAPDLNNNIQWLNALQNIEKNILEHVYHGDNAAASKHAQYNIYEHIKHGYIKLNNMSSQFEGELPCLFSQLSFVIKITGIWETDTEYGLVFKFISI